VIPQVFFDLIARVVPGALAIVLFGTAFRVNWSAFLNTLKDGPKAVSESAVLWMLTLLVFSYVLGHILSPLSKLLQDFIRFIVSKVIKLSPKPSKLLQGLTRSLDVDVIKPLFSNKPNTSQELA
jgi:hypothetical protein